MLTYLLVGFLGLVFGSFAGATVWRLRARQLAEDKKEGEPVDAGELKRLKPLLGHGFSNDRSRCLACGHELAWYDLIPLVSWATGKGKCRYCKQPIGWFEPTIELLTAGLFISFYHYWVSGGTVFSIELILWLVALVLLVILFVYDAKWFLLPNIVMWPFIAVSVAVALLQLVMADNFVESALSLLWAIVILAGLYFMLWFASRGAWVGFGDVKLGLGLALLLGEWQLAFLTVFLANLLGTIIVIPGLLSGKLSRKAHIPFGPLLILGFLISLYFGGGIIDATADYISTTLMLY